MFSFSSMHLNLFLVHSVFLEFLHLLIIFDHECVLCFAPKPKCIGRLKDGKSYSMTIFLLHTDRINLGT